MVKDLAFFVHLNFIFSPKQCYYLQDLNPTSHENVTAFFMDK